MSYQQINLNYCAQCKQIDKETVYNCCWLHFRFCCLACLKQFHAKIATECDLCKTLLDTNRIHVRDDVTNNHSYTFICDQCFDRRTPFAVHCHFCSKVCYKGFGAQNLTVSGLIAKYQCSTGCRAQSSTAPVEWLTKCSECDVQGKCDPISYDNQIYTICSTVCLDKFQQLHNIKIDNCVKCSAKFVNNVKHEYVFMDGDTRKSFCCTDCLHSHVREDSKMVICCICHNRMQFYNTIRRTVDDRCFCSLRCTIAAETGIKQLMQNDERCHMEHLILKYEPYESDSEMDPYDLIEVDRISDRFYRAQSIGSVTMNTVSGNEVTVSIQPEITSDFLERLTTAPKLSVKNNDTKCTHCRGNMDLKQLFVQWECLNFCSTICFEAFILSKNSNCVLCGKNSDSCCSIACAHFIANRIYFFCSERCTKTFLDLTIFCKFCRNIIDSTKELNGFCHLNCDRLFNQLYATSAVKQTSCTECHLTKAVRISFSFAGNIYEFCSHPCYFYRALSCGLFPEQCTICLIYFVKNKNDNTAYTLRHNRKLNIFCSQSCLSHYIYKYQFIQMCTICQRQKSNFNMIKSTVNDTTIEVNYCSIQCLQIVEQSTALEREYSRPTSQQHNKMLN